MSWGLLVLVGPATAPLLDKQVFDFGPGILWLKSADFIFISPFRLCAGPSSSSGSRWAAAPADGAPAARAAPAGCGARAGPADRSARAAAPAAPAASARAGRRRSSGVLAWTWRLRREADLRRLRWWIRHVRNRIRASLLRRRLLGACWRWRLRLRRGLRRWLWRGLRAELRALWSQSFPGWHLLMTRTKIETRLFGVLFFAKGPSQSQQAATPRLLNTMQGWRTFALSEHLTDLDLRTQEPQTFLKNNFARLLWMEHPKSKTWKSIWQSTKVSAAVSVFRNPGTGPSRFSSTCMCPCFRIFTSVHCFQLFPGEGKSRTTECGVGWTSCCAWMGISFRGPEPQGSTLRVLFYSTGPAGLI